MGFGIGRIEIERPAVAPLRLVVSLEMGPQQPEVVMQLRIGGIECDRPAPQFLGPDRVSETGRA